MDVDPRLPFGEDEDEEAEHTPPARTPPPPKKPLDVFLAEFERRLVEHPDQPATDAHLALEARAEGARWQTPGTRRPADPPPIEVEAEPEAAPEPQPESATEPPAPPEAAPTADPAQVPGRRRPRRRGHQRRRH